MKKLKTEATELRNKNILIWTHTVWLQILRLWPLCRACFLAWRCHHRTFNIGHITKLNDRGKITDSISAVYITKPPVLKNQPLTYFTPQRKSNVKTYLEFPFLEQLLCVCHDISHVQSLIHVQLFATSWTVVCQAPLSKEFFRQE